MTGISPSLFILAWMAIISCMMKPIEGMGRLEAAAMVFSIVTSLLAMLSEAGALDAEERDGKSRLDVALQVLALAAFMARLILFCWPLF